MLFRNKQSKNTNLDAVECLWTEIHHFLEKNLLGIKRKKILNKREID